LVLTDAVDLARRAKVPYRIVVTGCLLSLMGFTCGVASGASTPTATNLVASPALKAELVATFEADEHISAAAIVGIEPGALHYAYDRVTKTCWAVAMMEVSSHVSEQASVRLQDGGRNSIHARRPGHGWRVVWLVGPPYCSDYKVSNVPANVRALWGISGAGRLAHD
jgi:hypothetical protein